MKPIYYIGILFTLLLVCLGIGFDIGYGQVFGGASPPAQQAAASSASQSG